MKTMQCRGAVFGLWLVVCCGETFAGAGPTPTQEVNAATPAVVPAQPVVVSTPVVAVVAAPPVATSTTVIPGVSTTAIHVGYVCKKSDERVHFEEAEAKRALVGFPATYTAVKLSDILYDTNPLTPMTCWCFVGWTTGATKMFNGKSFLFEEPAANALMGATIAPGSFTALPMDPKIVLEAKVVCSASMSPEKAKSALAGGTVIGAQPTTISTLPGQQCYIVAKSDVDLKVKRKSNQTPTPIQDIAKNELGAYMRCKSSLSCP